MANSKQLIISKDKLNSYTLVLLLFIPSITPIIEINIAILSVVTFWLIYNFNFKYSKDLIQLVFPLIMILIISIFSTFFYSSEIFDMVKDFFFIAKPIFYIFIGYFLITKINDKDYLFKAIVYIAAFFAIIHIYKTVSYIITNDEVDINLMRNYAGRGSVLEVFALVLLFAKKGKELFKFQSKYKRIIITILIISFICYVSRTVTVSVVLLSLGVNGYLAITRKGLKYMIYLIVAITALYTYLFSIEPQRGAPGIEGFLYKIKIAPSEIFSSKIDVHDHVDLWDHWRAYEAQKAFEQLHDTSFHSALFMGKGIGSLVDLEFSAPLNGEEMQYISVLHNGYAFIAYKAGILGLMLFLVFLLILYKQAYVSSKTPKVIIINYLLSGIAIYYMFTTLIVTGTYNPRDFACIIIGGLLSIRYYLNKNGLEKVN